MLLHYVHFLLMKKLVWYNMQSYLYNLVCDCEQIKFDIEILINIEILIRILKIVQ